MISRWPIPSLAKRTGLDRFLKAELEGAGGTKTQSETGRLTGEPTVRIKEAGCQKHSGQSHCSRPRPHTVLLIQRLKEGLLHPRLYNPQRLCEDSLIAAESGFIGQVCWVVKLQLFPLCFSDPQYLLLLD